MYLMCINAENANDNLLTKGQIYFIDEQTAVSGGIGIIVGRTVSWMRSRFVELTNVEALVELKNQKTIPLP